MRQHLPRKLPQRKIHPQPSHHPHNRPSLRSVLRQRPQQEHAQQTPIRHARDRQPNLHHVPFTARMHRIHRHRKQHQCPHHGRRPRHHHPLALLRPRPPSHIKIHHRSRRQRIQCRTQIRHRRCQDRRHQQARHAHRHLVHNEPREDPIPIPSADLRQLPRMHPIKHKQPHPNQQEQRELHKDHHATRQQSQPRLLQILRRQHPLHHQLVRPMRSHRQKSPAQDPRPERIRRRKIHRKVQHVELARRSRYSMYLRPPTRHMLPQRPDRHHRPAHVDRHLHHVRPDHRRHPALERIQQRQRRNNPNRQHIARPNRDPHHNRHGKHPHALRRRPRQQKQPRRHLVQRPPKPPVDQLIRRQHLALKVLWQKQQRHHDAPHHVTNYDLQESKVPRERQPRSPDNRQRRSLRRNNRQRNRPPRHRLVGQKVSAKRPILRHALAREPQPEQRDRHQVQPNHAEIDRMQPHRHCLSIATRPQWPSS